MKIHLIFHDTYLLILDEIYYEIFREFNDEIRITYD